MSADMMTVDKQPVLRLQWLNKIRNEYAVQQEQIEILKLQEGREFKAGRYIPWFRTSLRRKWLAT